MAAKTKAAPGVRAKKPSKKTAARKSRRAAKPPQGDVLKAVEKDLKTLKVRGAESLAASARALARELDGENSAHSKSLCARVLMDTLDRLRELAPPQKTKDKVDELQRRRDARIKRSRRARRAKS